jgi:hypothetical protein
VAAVSRIWHESKSINNTLHFTSSTGQKREIYFHQLVLYISKTAFRYHNKAKHFKTNFTVIFPVQSQLKRREEQKNPVYILLILGTQEDC